MTETHPWINSMEVILTSLENMKSEKELHAIELIREEEEKEKIMFQLEKLRSRLSQTNAMLENSKKEKMKVDRNIMDAEHSQTRINDEMKHLLNTIEREDCLDTRKYY